MTCCTIGLRLCSAANQAGFKRMLLVALSAFGDASRPQAPFVLGLLSCRSTRILVSPFQNLTRLKFGVKFGKWPRPDEASSPCAGTAHLRLQIQVGWIFERENRPLPVKMSGNDQRSVCSCNSQLWRFADRLFVSICFYNAIDRFFWPEFWPDFVQKSGQKSRSKKNRIRFSKPL